jgi:hypothetical protein
MPFANATSDTQNGGAPPFSSLRDFERSTGSRKPTESAWHEPIKHSIRATVSPASMILDCTSPLNIAKPNSTKN